MRFSAMRCRALWAMAGARRPSLGMGALTEYAVFEADTPFLAHRPPGLDVVQAAALPTVGLTAPAIMATVRPRPGETILVIGATGGVGTTVLPLLAGSGATVIATAWPGDERTIAADRIIGYDEYPYGVDVVVNLALPSDPLAVAAWALRPGGRLYTITFPPPRPEFIGRDDVLFELILDREGTFGGMAEVAGLTATVAGTYRLSVAARAIRDFDREHIVGKLVVLM